MCHICKSIPFATNFLLCNLNSNKLRKADKLQSSEANNVQKAKQQKQKQTRDMSQLAIDKKRAQQRKAQAMKMNYTKVQPTVVKHVLPNQVMSVYDPAVSGYFAEFILIFYPPKRLIFTRLFCTFLVSRTGGCAPTFRPRILDRRSFSWCFGEQLWRVLNVRVNLRSAPKQRLVQKLDQPASGGHVWPHPPLEGYVLWKL